MFDMYGITFIDYIVEKKSPVVVRKGFRARKGEYTENPEDLRTYRNTKRF